MNMLLERTWKVLDLDINTLYAFVQESRFAPNFQGTVGHYLTVTREGKAWRLVLTLEAPEDTTRTVHVPWKKLTAVFWSDALAIFKRGGR